MSEQLLNPRQHKFVRLILNGATYSEAYRKAGFKAASDRAAASNGSRLMTNEKIKAALQDARQRPMAQAEVTTASIVGELEEARLAAMALGQIAAAVAASVGKAKMLGLVIDRKQVDVLHHKPALNSTLVELSVEEWQRQFDPQLALPQLQGTDHNER